MGKEIELKLAVTPDQQGRLSRHPLLSRAASRQTTKLVNIYYDTPDLRLHRHGIALRLRRDGRQWRQTVKCAGESSAGLSVRPEWEMPYEDAFDFSAIEAPKVRKLLQRIQHRLVPIFETNFKRITWQIHDESWSHVLVTLDSGEIIAAGKRTPISEVELELGEGEVVSLFSAAASLGNAIPLIPTLLSKAERGYQLFLNKAEGPTKAQSVPLTEKMPPLAAFRAIALGCLEHLQQNQAGAITGKDPEYIHQMRVAGRRLDATLRFFKPLLPVAPRRELQVGLKQLLQSLGNARDMDVLLADMVAPAVREFPRTPGLAQLAAGLAAEQRQAHQLVTAYLASPAYGQFLLRGIQVIHGIAHDTANNKTAQSGANFFGGYARKRIKMLADKVLRLGANATPEYPTALHALRIRIKHLRYAQDFLTPLSPKMHRPIPQLSRLQNELGWLNDLSNAGKVLLARAHTEPTLLNAVAKIGSCHLARYQKATKRIAKLLKAVDVKKEAQNSWN